MRVLVDTCVLSELNKPVPDLAARQAVEARKEEELFVSVMSIGEIRRGIALLAQGRKRETLRLWAAEIEGFYADRILSVDLDAARLWAELSVKARNAGRQIGTIDGLIAATALRHGLAVMTRNVRDFEAAGVVIVNPWNESSS